MTKGLDGILANLTRLQVRAPMVARAAVKEVADKFADELRKNTPKSDVFFDHLADEVVVTGFKGASEGIISKEIGYGRKTGWRSRFPDDGTIYQAPQGFKEKTINTMTPVAKEIYARKVREGLNL